MKNELLLAKSNLRKKKGISIGIALLMFIASLLISLCLLLFLDAYPNTEKYGKKLNSGDGSVIISNDTTEIDDTYLSNLLKDDVLSYDTNDYLYYIAKSVKYGSGDLSINMLLGNSSTFNKTMNKTEIVIEDSKYTSDYIYLPYQFNTTGGYEIGDKFMLGVKDKQIELTVRGFTNNTFYGCPNSGPLEFVADDINYEFIKAYTEETSRAIVVSFQTNDTITPKKLCMKISNSILSVNSKSAVNGSNLDATIANRGFMSLILAVSFLTVTSILCLIIVLMLTNCISNIVKESMKEIGALKAIGYTSRNIVSSMVLQFIFLAIISSIVGIVASYCAMPFVAKMVSSQQGLPYSVSFNAIATFVPLIFMIAFTSLVVFFATRKIRKIEPIVALRDGLETHNFKKNRIPLDKSKLSLNTSLSLKTLFTNLKQNVITFVITGFLSFVSVIGLLMYENFNRNPMLEILTFETFSGLVTVDKTVKDDVYDYLSSRDDIHNVREIYNDTFTYGDNEDEVVFYIIDDVSRLNNVNVCYEGNLPKYDNEIALSGKFAQEYNYNIGDTIEFGVSNKKESYLICGLLQSCNNSGREGLVSKKGAKNLVNLDAIDGYFWFDCDDKIVNSVIDDCKTLYGDKFLSSMNFNEIVEGAMTSFKTISALMLIIISGVSVAVILLVLYLLIKSLIHNKRKEFGVLKALGYRNKDLMLQTALSFMPSIILSSIIFSILSYFTSNTYMNLIMINFGLVKCSFNIPVLGVAIIAVSMCVISFLFALLESKKIKNIEPYNLLIAE